MSLLNKATMTERKLAASRNNGKLSHGPVTAEGRQRIAAAHLRHGRRVESQDGVLRCWGEDPVEYEGLLEGLYREFTPAGALQERLLKHLARVLWLIERSDRRQDGDALLRAKSVDSGRENRMHARMMRLKMTAETLRSLARSVAGWHYVTTRDDLDIMKKLHQEGGMAEMGEIALGLFYQLQPPGADQDGTSEDEKRRGMVNSIRSIFGLPAIESDVQMLTPSGETMIIRANPPGESGEPSDGEDSEATDEDDRFPGITEEDWRVRERARKLLRNILAHQAEVCEEQRKALLTESLAIPSPYERAAEIGPSLQDAWMVRRVEDANFREVRRLTSLLMKLKRQERPAPRAKTDGSEPSTP
jgi:hypothetical protein